MNNQSLSRQTNNKPRNSLGCSAFCMPVKIQLILIIIIAVVFIINIIYLSIWGNTLDEFDSIENHKLKLYYMMIYLIFGIFLVLILMYLCEECMFKTALTMLLIPYSFGIISVILYYIISNNPNYPLHGWNN